VSQVLFSSGQATNGALSPGHFPSKLLKGNVETPELGKGLFSRAALIAKILQSLGGNQPLKSDPKAGTISELQYLTHESDPQLFYEGLLNLGKNLERRDQLAEATAVYEAIIAQPLESIGVAEYRGIGENPSASNSPTHRYSDTPTLAQQAQQAQERLDAIHGVGSSALRLEFNFRRIGHEAASPTGLFAMGAAGVAFKLTKLATLSRLATTPLGFLGRQAIAHSAAFFAETATFTLAGKTAAQLTGIKQDWRPKALAHEWAGGAAMLLGLKAMGGLTNAAVRRLGVGVHGRAPLQQFGMLTGIMLGNKLSELGHFREHHDDATSLTDSLLTLLQFNVSGHLLHGAMGEGFRKWEQRVDIQSEALARRDSGTPKSRYLPWDAQFAAAGGVGVSEYRGVGVGENLNSMQMSAHNGDEGGGRDGSGEGRDGIESGKDVDDLLSQTSPASPPTVKSRGHLPTIPFIKEGGNPDATLPFITVQEESGKDPSQNDHPLQLARRIQDEDLKFAELLLEKDAELNLRGDYPIEPYLPAFTKIFDNIARKTETHYKRKIDSGRKVVLYFANEAELKIISFVRRPKGFEVIYGEVPEDIGGEGDSIAEVAPPSSTTTESETPEEASSELQGILGAKGSLGRALGRLRRATAILSPTKGPSSSTQRPTPDSGTPVAATESNSSPESPRSAFSFFASARSKLPESSPKQATGQIKQIKNFNVVTSQGELLDFLGQVVASNRVSLRTEVWVDLIQPFDMERVQRALEDLKSGKVLVLHVPESRVSHTFQKSGDSVMVRQKEWNDIVSFRDPDLINVNRSLEARNLLDLLRQVSLQRGLSNDKQGPFSIMIRGKWDAKENNEILLECLSLWTDLPFSELELRYPGRGGKDATLVREVFHRNDRGRWVPKT
jgi:hypothetical protein